MTMVPLSAKCGCFFSHPSAVPLGPLTLACGAFIKAQQATTTTTRSPINKAGNGKEYKDFCAHINYQIYSIKTVKGWVEEEEEDSRNDL